MPLLASQDLNVGNVGEGSDNEAEELSDENMLKHHRTRVQYQQYKGYTVATVAKLNV
jgi:hypothetical protein